MQSLLAAGSSAIPFQISRQHGSSMAKSHMENPSWLPIPRKPKTSNSFENASPERLGVLCALSEGSDVALSARSNAVHESGEKSNPKVNQKWDDTLNGDQGFAERQKSEYELMCDDKAEVLVKSVRNGTLTDEQIHKSIRNVLVIAMKNLVRNDELSMSHDFFGRIAMADKVDDHVMAVLLKGTSRLKGVQTAMRLLRFWLDEGYPVEYGTSDVGIRSLVEAKNVDGACELLDELRNRTPLRPFAYNIVMQGAALEGKMDIAVRAFGWLCDSQTPLDSFSFRNVLWAIHEDAGRDHLFWIYAELKRSDVKLYSNIYFAFMYAAGKCRELKLAKRLYKEFTTNRIPDGCRTPKVVNVLLDVHSKCNSMLDFVEVAKMFDDLNLLMDEVTFGLLFTAAYRSKADLSATKGIFMEMSRRKVKFNKQSAASAVICCVNAEQDPVEDRFNLAMKITRVAGTHTCYHLVLGMACSHGFVSIAGKIQQEMKDRGLAQTRRTLSVIHDGYLQANLLEEANKYWQMLRRN